MRFRFTISRTIDEPAPFPELSSWEHGLLDLVSADDLWVTGVAPEVVMASISGASDTSDYLFVEYDFHAGWTYKIDVTYTMTNDTGSPLNPRSAIITIKDDDNNTLFTDTDSMSIGSNVFSFEFLATSECTKVAFRIVTGSDRTVVVDSVAWSITDFGINSYVINEPDGWKQCTLKLSRDPVFHSVIEHFEGSFIFYGDNGMINGGYHPLKLWDEEEGPDADINIQIEYTDDDSEWYDVFTGQLDMSLAEWMIDNKVRIPIIPDNFWATFMNRKDTPVNLLSTTDIDESEVEEPVDDITIDLPSQKIRYNGEYHWLDTFTYYKSVDMGDDLIAQLDWDETVVDDLKKFNIPRALIEINDATLWDLIVGIFEVPWDGDYEFDIRIESAYYDEVNDLWVPASTTVNPRTYRIAIVGSDISGTVGFGSANPDTLFSSTNVTYGSDEITVSTYNRTLKLFKGQQVAIWGRPGVGVPAEYFSNLTVFGERQLSWSDVRLATTGVIVLSGEQTIDGETTSSDLVLVKNQGDPSQNGVYLSGAGAWTRATGFDTGADLVNKAVYVTEGDTNEGSAWRQTQEEIAIDVDSVNWVYILPSDERFRPYPGTAAENHLIIVADTVFKKTHTTGFLLHDAFAGIAKQYGLGYPNPFYSEILGSERTLARQYEENGCFWPYGLTRGLQLRGYSLSEKPFSMSFMECWNGADPIFNLGLGYEQILPDVIEPDITTVADMDDWEDAGGDHPGTWTYSFPATPHVSVNGSGGVSGYTKGACATVAGDMYIFSFVLEILDTGVSGEITQVTVAILDASDNEIETEVFNYGDAGFKFETFTMTPAADGVSVAMRITNNTPIDTKTYYLRLFIGSQGQQFLLNSDFDDTSAWTHDGTGFPWVISGGAANLTLETTPSEGLMQDIANAGVGNFLLAVRRTTTNFDVSDSSNFAINVYDEDDNVIGSTAEFITGNNTNDIIQAFSTIVPPVRVRMIADVNSGSDFDISVDFFKLWGPISEAAIEIEGEKRLRIEKREYFYDPDPVVFLSNIRNVSRRYDTDLIFKKVLIGYKQWRAEDISGIDDPQTKHTYASQLKKTGEEIEVLSEFIAASLAVEQARRQSIDKSTDYQFDDNTFIIALNAEEESISPDFFVPETDENFTVINNLLNSDTRYNIRITPARNFLRHLNWFNIGLQSYIGSLFKFTRGEGNYDLETAMLTTCAEEDYGGELLAEGQNLVVTDDALHTPHYYDVDYKMSLSEYRQIAQYKNKSIGVSITDADHIPFFIDDLSYHPVLGNLKISGWTKEYWDIKPVEGLPPTQICFIPSEEPPVVTDCVLYDDNTEVFYDDETCVSYEN